MMSVLEPGEALAPFICLRARIGWIYLQGTDPGRLQPISWESKSMLGRNSRGQSDSWRMPRVALSSLTRPG